jgi:hypothetical protein
MIPFIFMSGDPAQRPYTQLSCPVGDRRAQAADKARLYLLTGEAGIKRIE